jgi:FdhD protein
LGNKEGKTSEVYKGIKYCKEIITEVEDNLAVEQGLQIFINNNPFSVTMCSPGNELELVRGLLFTEDIFTDKDFEMQLEWIKEENPSAIKKVNIALPENLLQKSYSNSRSLLSVSSCGICGNKELELVNSSSGKIEEGKFNVQKLHIMFGIMNSMQHTFKESGGSHAAAAFSQEGELLSLHEDIGRHNAVDKVIGKLLINKNLESSKYLLVSGRVSYEIIAKCFKAKIPVLAAVSAPSTLSVDFAKELGISLFGFCREERVTLYS